MHHLELLGCGFSAGHAGHRLSPGTILLWLCRRLRCAGRVCMRLSSDCVRVCLLACWGVVALSFPLQGRRGTLLPSLLLPLLWTSLLTSLMFVH